MEKINLLQIDPRGYDHSVVALPKILFWFRNEEAFWEHQGDPSPDKPHAELVSGLCSGGYFDVPRVLRYPNVAEILGRQLGRKLRKAGVGQVDWVVSSAYSAITFGHEVAKELGAIFQNTEKDPADSKKQLWQRMAIPAGANVLQAEELMTTTGTAEQVRQAIEKGNPYPVNFLSVIGALILRPEKLLSEYGGRKIVALVEKEIRNFDPKKNECPHCAVGSPRYRPKTHWAELTGKR